MKPGAQVTLAVLALFLLMACAWTAMFYFARQAHIESVPLATPASPAEPPPRPPATPRSPSAPPPSTPASSSEPQPH